MRDEQLNHFAPYIHSHSFSYLGEEKIPFFWDNCYVNGLGKNHHQQTDEFAEKTFISVASLNDCRFQKVDRLRKQSKSITV